MLKFVKEDFAKKALIGDAGSSGESGHALSVRRPTYTFNRNELAPYVGVHGV